MNICQFAFMLQCMTVHSQFKKEGGMAQMTAVSDSENQ